MKDIGACGVRRSRVTHAQALRKPCSGGLADRRDAPQAPRCGAVNRGTPLSRMPPTV